MDTWRIGSYRTVASGRRLTMNPLTATLPTGHENGVPRTDVTGVSGSGEVAEGIQFADGQNGLPGATAEESTFTFSA